MIDADEVRNGRDDSLFEALGGFLHFDLIVKGEGFEDDLELTGIFVLIEGDRSVHIMAEFVLHLEVSFKHGLEFDFFEFGVFIIGITHFKIIHLNCIYFL